MPAGWAGVQMLLCCLGGPNLPEFLDTAWRAAGTVYEPLEYWSDPATVWIWLPSPSHRPAAMAELGCGASVAHITAALDRAHPDLRAAFRTQLDQEITEYLRSDYGDDFEHDTEAARSRDRLQVPEAVLDRFWPAAIAPHRRDTDPAGRPADPPQPVARPGIVRTHRLDPRPRPLPGRLPRRSRPARRHPLHPRHPGPGRP